MFRRYKTFCCGCALAGLRLDTSELDLGLPDARVADEPDTDSSMGKETTARRFGWKEIESLTGGFTSAVVGEGGFSMVYLARIPCSAGSAVSSSLGAVKIHRGSSERLHRVFQQELDVLRRVRHPNVVRLLGFCDDREEGVLVLEFAPNGNLYDKLHSKNGAVLPWSKRVSVALQIAKALEYLHERLELQIIHGDVKASNILLDSNMDAKLCDFGSARMGFSAAVRPRSAHQMLGSPGYVDPHYIRSGVVTKKNDVYSFGVLVLEILTGMEAFCTEKEQLLTAVVGPRLRDLSGGAGDLVDSRLGAEYDAAEAATMAAVAALCVGENAGMRPSMAEVVRILEEKVHC